MDRYWLISDKSVSANMMANFESVAIAEFGHQGAPTGSFFTVKC